MTEPKTDANETNALLAVAESDGVLPEGFYATTNFETDVRVNGVWQRARDIEMDVALVVEGETVRAVPMHRVRRGDEIVIGDLGIRVVVPESTQGEAERFRFMASSVSSERPKAHLVAEVARAMKAARESGKRILFVGGPAIVHSGSGPHLQALIEAGWIDVLFAGNALALHDLEAAMFGTSLGIDLGGGPRIPHGHQHHLRAVNRVRRAGSIAEAVRQGLVTTGIMHACIVHQTPFVLAGSIRDDGPLPEVVTDALAAADAMRAQLPGVGVAILCATTLHAVATGNMLRADVATFCVDASAETVIKLVDRGTHQATGIVTDCAYFLGELLAACSRFPPP